MKFMKELSRERGALLRRYYKSYDWNLLKNFRENKARRIS